MWLSYRTTQRVDARTLRTMYEDANHFARSKGATQFNTLTDDRTSRAPYPMSCWLFSSQSEIPLQFKLAHGPWSKFTRDMHTSRIAIYSISYFFHR